MHTDRVVVFYLMETVCRGSGEEITERKIILMAKIQGISQKKKKYVSLMYNRREAD